MTNKAEEATTLSKVAYEWYRDTALASHAFIMPAVVRALGKRSGRILDLGCGNGALVRGLVDLGYDAYGIDAVPQAIEFANAAKPGRFAVADIEQGTLPAEFARIGFQTVISTETIEHMYAPRTLLRMARAVLEASGGQDLIVSTPYHGYLKNLALAVTGKLDSHFTVLWDGGHIKFFSRATLGKMLEEEGFEATGFEGLGRALPWMWKSMLVTARRRT